MINLDVLGYNRPDQLLYLRAINAHSKLKYKLKAIYRMCKNYFMGFFKGEDVFKVAGRPANKQLVETISDTISKLPDIRVERIIDNDCG